MSPPLDNMKGTRMAIDRRAESRGSDRRDTPRYDLGGVFATLNADDEKFEVVDIGDLVRDACETAMPHIVATIKAIVASADPEYQPVLRNNVILSGGGSLIQGVADRIADELSDIGDVNVWCVEDAIGSVAAGALKLAGEMPDDMYTAIN